MYFKNTCCDQIIDNDAKHFFSVMYMQSTPNPYASIYFYWSHISSHISQKSHFKRGFTKVVVTRADPSREWSQRELRLYMKFIYSSFQGRFFITVLFSIHFCSTRFLTVFTLKTDWTLCRLAVEWYLICEIFLPSRRRDVAKSYIFTPQVSVTTSFSLKKITIE